MTDSGQQNHDEHKEDAKAVSDDLLSPEELAKMRVMKDKVAAIAGELLRFYEMRMDLSGLLEDMPIKDGEEETPYLRRFLERLGFQSTLESVEALPLAQVDRPHLVHCPHAQEGYALAMPTKVYGTDRFVFAASEDAQKTLQNEPYTGEVIVLDRTSQNIGDYISHMKTGHSLDWFWMPILRYRRNYYEIIMASLFINLLVLAVPLYSLNIYDRVAVNFIPETLYVLTFGVILAMLFDFFFKNLRTYVLERLAERLGRDFDFKLMERLMMLRGSDQQTSIGEQVNMFRELHSIREFYASKLVPTMVDMPFVALFIFIIYAIGGAVAFVPLATILLIIVINILAHLPISKMMSQYFSTIQKKSSYLVETLAGMETLRMFNAHSHRLFHWDRATAAAARVSRHNSVLLTMLSNLTFTLSQVCHVMVIFVGIYLVQDNQLTIGGIITCSILSGRTIAPAMGFSSLLSRLKQSEDVLKSIDKFFSLPHFDDNNITKAPKGPFQGAFQISDISYVYPGQDRPALHQVSLDIPAGTHIGIIGQSAAGKSTLAKMIGQLLVPQEGEITLDGFQLDHIPHTELCRTVTYAPQDSFFFRGSVMQNITLGRTDIDPEALREAIDVSGLELVLKQNAQGLDMEVGENGCCLSGGQKQALSLARALVRRPQVLIFDEPTTGMDNALEAHVQAKLKAYTQGKTFIMITHRTSLLSLVDRLVLVDKGRILADGPKQEILNKLAGKG